MKGWWGSPGVKGATEDRENSDGEHDLPTYNQSRLVTLDGLLQAKSHEDMHEAMDYISGPMRGRLVVAGHGSDRWIDAKLDGEVDPIPITDTLMSWQIPLKSTRPWKFGELRTFDVTPGAPARAFHRGNTNASPVVQINGPLAGGFTITHPGGQYIALGDLGVGGWIRVDFRTGRLRLNGNDRSDLIIRADLYQVPPGVPVSGYGYSFSLSNGSGYVELTDTYK